MVKAPSFFAAALTGTAAGIVLFLANSPGAASGSRRDTAADAAADRHAVDAGTE